MTIVRDMPPLPPPEQAGTDHLQQRQLQQPQSQSKQEQYNLISPPEEQQPNVSQTSQQQHTYADNNVDADPKPNSVATLSNAWEYDDLQPFCTTCRAEFNPINRKHHCRMCGKIFCNSCSNQRALIPPSSIVLVPDSGKKAKPTRYDDASIRFSPDPDPDRMLTYVDEDQQLLYGKGLEERFKLAREPLRVCHTCCAQLGPLQEELRNANSNAMRFNHIDPTDPRRLFNSPLAFTLGHEIRKAAFTLNNLLPLPKKMGAVVDANAFVNQSPSELQQCKDECSTMGPSLSGLDGVRIPARLLQQAKGVAVMTVIKGGFGMGGVEFGTGLAVARLGEHWSAPCAIGTGGVSWGGTFLVSKWLGHNNDYFRISPSLRNSIAAVFAALIGAQVCDHVFLLMTDAAVELMFSNSGSVQLGADVGVAVGPLGRALEADFGAAPGNSAPIYTYSLSKGLYAGVSLDGKIIVTRERVNERFYGKAVSGMEILHGEVPTPPAARPLYEALQRCHVYASDGIPNAMASRGQSRQQQPHFLQQFPQQQYPGGMTVPKSSEMEYGELPEPIPMIYPPATNDQHSYAGMSDLTTDPGY